MSGKGLAAAGLLVVAGGLAIRAHRLDLRPYHHDEAIHGYDAWLIARVAREGTAHDHVYNPTYHGPLRYYVTAAVFAVLGDTDATGRLVPLAFGTLLVALPLAFIPELGARAALILSILLAASPLQIYYARFLRDDPLMLVFTVLHFGMTARGIRQRRLVPVALGSACLGLAFCTMENAYIVALTFASSLGILGVFQTFCLASGPGAAWRIGSIPRARLVLGHARDVATAWPGVVQGLCWLLAFASFNLAGALMADLEPMTRAAVAAVLVASIGAIAAAAILDQARRVPSTDDFAALWRGVRGPLVGAVAFAIPFAVSYTNALVHPGRLGTGLFSALQYWIGQQGKPRLDGPFLHYVPLLCLHEPVVFLLPCAVAFTGLPRLTRWILVILLLGTAALGIAGDRFILGSAIDDVVRQAAAGRMPLDLAAALTITLAFGHAAWRAFLRRNLTLTFSWLWALASFLLYAWAREKVPWLGLHIQLPLAAVTAQILAAATTRRRVAVLALALALAAHSRWLQVRTLECNFADPLVYVQTVPRIRPILERLEADLAGGRKLVIQSDVCVPFYWYLRGHAAVYPERIERVDPVSLIITKKGSEGAADKLPRRTFYYYGSQVHQWAKTGMGVRGLQELLDWLPAYLLWRDQTPFWKGGYQASVMMDPVIVVSAGSDSGDPPNPPDMVPDAMPSPPGQSGALHEPGFLQ